MTSSLRPSIFGRLSWSLLRRHGNNNVHDLARAKTVGCGTEEVNEFAGDLILTRNSRFHRNIKSRHVHVVIISGLRIF